jgi:Putative Ig domain
LPPGIRLTRRGHLIGTPTTPGLFGFTVQVVDVRGFVGNRAYRLRIH